MQVLEETGVVDVVGVGDEVGGDVPGRRMPLAGEDQETPNWRPSFCNIVCWVCP